MNVVKQFTRGNKMKRLIPIAAFAAAPAFLVSFTGVSPDGNPSGRRVTRVHVPVPRGISLRTE